MKYAPITTTSDGRGKQSTEKAAARSYDNDEMRVEAYQWWNSEEEM